jgi:hypothetical protein
MVKNQSYPVRMRISGDAPSGNPTKEMIRILSSWRQSGLHVICGKRLSPNDAMSMESRARYIIRTSFSQERMQYLDQQENVVQSILLCMHLS